jgi:thiol:disulfide interchange protein DsbD
VLPAQEGRTAPEETDVEPRSAARTASVEETADRFAGRGVVVAVLLSFLAGLGLTLTPCIYPLIPVTISLVGATSGRGRLDGLVRSVVYVFGLSVTYSAVGVVAAATGGMFGSFLQNPIVYLALAAIFVLLAGAMFDWYSLDIVSRRLQSFQAGLHGRAGLVGVWLVGLLSGAAATSCVAPIIVGIFVYVGQKGSLLLGFLMFFALAWGIGTPLVVLGTFTGLLKGLPKSGEWMLRVKHFFGLVLLAVAAYFLGRSHVLPPLWYTMCLGAFLLGLSVFVGAFDQIPPETGAWHRFRKAIGLLLFVGALGVFVPAAWELLPAGGRPSVSQREEPIEWLTSEVAAVERGEALGKPLLLDFWAEHCPACVRMLEETFHDPGVVAEAEHFVCAKIDLTDKDDPDVRRLQEKYDIRGVPLVVLVNTDGTRRSYAEYIAPERLVRILQSVR